MKHRARIYVILSLAAIIFPGSFFADRVPDSSSLRNIAFKLSSYNNKFPQQKVYLHTDKSKYNFDEKLWIKAYLVDAATHKHDGTDNNLYVEIVNPSGYVVQTKIVRMDEGLGRVDFSFRDTVPEGFYLVRAFTNWMRNFSDDYYFTKDIYVANPLFTTQASREAVAAEKKAQRKSIRREPGYDVSFLPEGGHLLSNVPNRVAFKAINQLGEGIDIEGVLKDKRRNTVLRFSSSHMGMGAFTFTPEKGNKYTAHISAAGRKEMKFQLPRLVDMGISISANHINDDISVNINTNLGTGNFPPNTTYYFFAHVRGKPVFSTEFDIRNPENLNFTIPKKNIPTGIVHLTLFNYFQAPVSERVIFVNNNDQLIVNINPNQFNYSKREKVNLKIDVKDHAGKPVQSNFSLSVAEEESSDKSVSMVSSLLLSSDLKGYIEDPDYYFINYNPEKEKNLDYLMMTQGWRRFGWSEVFSEQRLPPAYQKQNGLIVSGRITRDFFNIPLRDIKVTLTIFDQFNDVFETRTDYKGNFKYTNLYYLDTIGVRLEASREGGRKNLVIHIDDFEQSRFEEMKYRTNQLITRRDPKGKRIEDEEPEDDDPFKEENTRISRIHSEPRDVIIMDESLYNYQSVLQVIQGRVPGVNVVGNRVIIRGVSTLYGSTDPLFLVDGIPVDPNYALSMSPYEVERIEVLKGADASVYGLRGGNGVIAIYTRRGKFMIRGRIDFGMLGYAIPSEFYSPRYVPEKTDPFPDDRQTLLWVPEIKTNSSGTAEVEFFTSDKPGPFVITMEGISKEGVPGTGRQNIIVR